MSLAAKRQLPCTRQPYQKARTLLTLLIYWQITSPGQSRSGKSHKHQLDSADLSSTQKSEKKPKKKHHQNHNLKNQQKNPRLNLLSTLIPKLQPCPPNHETLRKRRASQPLDKTGYNATKSIAQKRRKSISSRKTQAEMDTPTQNNSTSADSDTDMDELAQDSVPDVHQVYQDH